MSMQTQMHVLKATIVSFVLMTGFSAAVAQSAPPERAAAARPTRQTIIGAWRLVGIDYSGPNGALPDPVFGPNPQGILIYDQSGWMSVQIATADRPAMARPAARTSRVLTLDDAKLATLAFDSYYAYFGTWDYDPTTSVITHHLNSSLLPYETGLDYRREVTFDGGHLKLSALSQVSGEERRRTLTWARVSAPPAAVQSTSPTPASEPKSESPTPAHEAAATKYGDMPADYEEVIRQYFQKHLKHPDSVRYQEITKPRQGYTTAITGTFLMREKREYGWTVKATIDAKNSHDSYVGFKTYTFLFRGEKIVDARLPLPGDEMNEPAPE
jgi:hypothetical protein